LQKIDGNPAVVRLKKAALCYPAIPPIPTIYCIGELVGDFMLHTLISNPVNKTSWNKMDMVTNLLCFIIIFAAQCIVASTASDLFVDHILAEKSVFLNKDAGYSLTKKGDALKTSLHDVTFAIKQQNLDQLNQILYEVSDPRNPKYGQHWTRQQVTSLVSNPSATENVQKYLEDRGIHVEKVSKYGEYIQATATISTWEELFQTQFFEFHDEVYDITFARALEYSLPALISGDLTGVLGVADYFPPIGAAAIQPATDRLKKITTEAISSLKNKRSLKSNGKKSSTDSSPTLLCVDAGYSLCMAYPQLLYDYYNISSPYGSNSVTQGIYGSLNQAFSPIDLTTFQEGFNVTVHPIAGSINGHVYNNACYVSIDDCAEASLDIQYITSIAQSVPTYYYYYADATLNGFANWLVAVSEMDNPPDLFSISYGGNEAGTSISSEQSFNTEAQKLGVMGISLINSSGDNGAPGSSAAGHPGNCAYAPAFPSSSPYVTSVGATQVRVTLL
jgi:tripeptidyl-peptidase-1